MKDEEIRMTNILESYNPATGDKLGKVKIASPEEIK